ncbi:hypothetical protein AB0L74_32560 [Streptomyces sp. NPDC052020]|uniref:hypothetical protein n=1 Tax=Streptomyces sp. NPDC052020 TaxID=3155677 RepID=UPI00342F712C
MTEISQSQLQREAMELELWKMPPPQPDAATMSKLSQLASKSEQVTGNQPAGDDDPVPDLGPLQAFKTWDSVASTIWHKAATSTNFQPASTTFDPVAWTAFINKLGTFPMFLRWVTDNRQVVISSTSVSQAVSAVDDLVKNFVTETDYKGILTSLQKMATLAMNNEGQDEKDSQQQAGVISHYQGKLYVGAVRTAVEMRYKKGKGYEQLTQNLSIFRGYGVLDFDGCKRHADELFKWDGQSLSEWAGDSNSANEQPNQSPAWGN